MARELVADNRRLKDALIRIVATWDVTRATMPVGLQGHVTPEQFRASQEQLVGKAIEAARREVKAPTWIDRTVEKIGNR
jgi:hypothetical protein